MTADTTDTQHNRSFLSTLRERSAIVFTIGLALSLASFVENLHMGKDAIAFVVAELSKIDGWADAVQAVAAIFHGALEWWRGVLRDLLSFLPFQVPQWLHDPLSVFIFGFTRVLVQWNNIRKFTAEREEAELARLPAAPENAPDHIQNHLEKSKRQIQQLVALEFFRRMTFAFMRIVAMYILPMCVLYVLDLRIYANAAETPQELAMLTILALSFFVILYLFNRPTRNIFD